MVLDPTWGWFWGWFWIQLEFGSNLDFFLDLDFFWIPTHESMNKGRGTFFNLTSKLSEYAFLTSSSDLAVFVNFDMLITKIISIFPNLACLLSTSASKFEIYIDAYDLILASISVNGNFKLWSRTRDTGRIRKNAYDFRNQHIKIDKKKRLGPMKKWGRHILTVYLSVQARLANWHKFMARPDPRAIVQK